MWKVLKVCPSFLSYKFAFRGSSFKELIVMQAVQLTVIQCYVYVVLYRGKLMGYNNSV